MSKPTPLIMVPGLLCNQRIFEAQAEVLAEHAEISFAGTTSFDSIEAMAQAALSSAPERFALCGFSMGGYVCLEILRRAPERVDRLALISTNARPDSETSREFRRNLLAVSGAGRFREAVDMVLHHLLPETRRGETKLTELFHAMAREVGPADFERQQHAIMARPDGRHDLAAISCQTLVLCGRDDPLMPLDMHLEMAAAIADATLVVLPGCGHLATIEKSREVAEQLCLWYRA
jgi:pimeloyl-ACP methyl ester carboxylesterase